MYFPKSQITTNLSTNGKEFQIVGKSEYYIGSYFKTSDGKFYTGKTPQDGVNRLLTKNPIVNDKNLEAVTPIDSNISTSISRLPLSYSASSKSLPIKVPPPQSSIVFPTDEEYDTGEYQRYFLKHKTNHTYLEVTQFTYTNFINLSPTVQFQLYTAIKIDWILVGKPIEVYKVNRNIVLLYEKENNIRGFFNYLKGRYLRYYRPLQNKYYTTKGGELKVQDTNENYAGSYHVHSTSGVIMEGRFHSASPHKILIPFEGDEIKGSIKIKVDNEVGTSRRINYQRNSGY